MSRPLVLAALLCGSFASVRAHAQTPDQLSLLSGTDGIKRGVEHCYSPKRSAVTNGRKTQAVSLQIGTAGVHSRSFRILFDSSGGVAQYTESEISVSNDSLVVKGVSGLFGPEKRIAGLRTLSIKPVAGGATRRLTTQLSGEDKERIRKLASWVRAFCADW